MIQLELTNYEAIALHALLDNLGILCSSGLPESVRLAILTGHRDDPELDAAKVKLTAQLDGVLKRQKQRFPELRTIQVETVTIAASTEGKEGRCRQP